MHEELGICQEVKLFRTEPCKFYVIEQGDYLPILTGATYTLIKKEYVFVFENIQEVVNLQPVSIFDGIKKSVHVGYIELITSKTIDPESILTENATGKKIWTYNGELFVSDEIKQELNSLSNEFYFSKGFSLFG